jgi:hypothetical protein
MLPAMCSQPPCQQRQVDRVWPRRLRDGKAAFGRRPDKVHSGRDLARDRTESGGEGVQAPGRVLQQQEDRDVDPDDGERDEGGTVTALVLVADGEHGPDSRASRAP